MLNLFLKYQIEERNKCNDIIEEDEDNFFD